MNILRGYRSVLLVVLLFADLVLGLLDPAIAAQPAATSSNTNSVQAQTASSDCQTDKGFGLNAAGKNLLGRLQTAAGSGGTIACHAYTGVVRFLSTEPGKPVARAAALPAKASPEEATRQFMSDYGSLFGLSDQAKELSVMRAMTGESGNNFVRYQQLYQGLPIIGGEIIIQVDPNQQVVSAGGEFSPGLNLDVTPQLTADQARRQAFARVARSYKADPAHLTASNPELAVYDPRLLADVDGYGQLVWKMTVNNDDTATSSEPVEEFVLVNAQTGAIALSFSQVEYAKNRRICNQNDAGASGPSDCTSPVRVEGGSVNAVADVNQAYDNAGYTYDFYKNNFNRDSLNGAGLILKQTVKFCYTGGCPGYQNAFWSFGLQQMFYGDGFAAGDDVVGHEMTHGFTQFTSNLFYSFESGAINESLSDTFGEYIDQTDGHDGCAGSSPAQNWLIGEDLPPPGGNCNGQIRNMQNPPAFQDPDKVSSPNYYTGLADNAGVHTNSGIGNKAAYLIAAGDTFNGQTITGLGIPKAAQVYYELETHVLTSAANYRDLYNYLPRACTNLIGTHGITATDCQQVTKTVIATEMNLNPPGARIDAPVCATGQIPTNLFFDNMENPSSGNWSGQVSPNPWSYSTLKPYSGSRSLYGANLPSTSDTNIHMNSSVTLPANAFMSFRQYFQFEYDSRNNYDGGVVEYSTNGGSAWTDAGALFDYNGYPGTIYTGFGNPLANRGAFVNISRSYYSSRLSLNSLAGQSVRFRFRIGSDSSYSDIGWLIDDVQIYTCATPTTTTSLTSSANPAYSGQPVTFNATVSTTGPVAPTGNVTFKDGSTDLATVALSGNVASYSTSGLTAGAHAITAMYAGDGNNQGSTSNAVNQQINLANSVTTLVSSANPTYSGQPLTLTAYVTSPGAPPTGSITFYDGATSLGTVSLANGSASYTTSALSIGTHSLTAVYTGDGNNNGSTSAVLSQPVIIAPTTLTLITSASPVFDTQSVTFKANVTNPWGGVPTGSVTFKDGSTPLGSPVMLTGGSASLTTSSLSTGAVHVITAEYTGDGNNSASTSNEVGQQILTPAPSCTTLTVTTTADDNSCGSLRQALALAHANAFASSGSTVVQISSSSVTGPILLNGASGGVTLGLGITLERQDGGCGLNGPDQFVQAGSGSTGDGITLNKANLIGVWVSGFAGRQIVAFGGQSSGESKNILKCVKATKSNP